MVQSTQGRGVSVLDLERQIAAEVKNVLSIREQRHFNCGQPSVRTPSLAMPGYVEHSGGATEIAKLSAEAIVREYEAAAKEIEGMGAQLIQRVKQCEEMTRDALAVTKEMSETAGRYREEAKRIFLEIENCSLMTAEVRKTCADLKGRIATPTTALS